MAFRFFLIVLTSVLKSFLCVVVKLDLSKELIWLSLSMRLSAFNRSSGFKSLPEEVLIVVAAATLRLDNVAAIIIDDRTR